MSTLVLLSGGLDSAVLAAHEAQRDRVRPVYVSVGLAWEAAELAMLDRLLAAPALANTDPMSRVATSIPRRIGRFAACRPLTTRRMRTSI